MYQQVASKQAGTFTRPQLTDYKKVNQISDSLDKGYFVQLIYLVQEVSKWHIDQKWANDS